MDVEVVLQVLLADQRGVHVVHGADHLADLPLRRLQLDGARIGAGVGEDFLDHRQQLPARADHGLHRVALPVVQLAEKAVAQDLAVGDQRGERRTELVRHVGQKPRLGDVQVAKLQHAALQLLDPAERRLRLA